MESESQQQPQEIHPLNTPPNTHEKTTNIINILADCAVHNMNKDYGFWIGSCIAPRLYHPRKITIAKKISFLSLFHHVCLTDNGRWVRHTSQSAIHSGTGWRGAERRSFWFRWYRKRNNYQTLLWKRFLYCYRAYQNAFERIEHLLSLRKGPLNIDDILNDGQCRWLILDDLLPELGNSSKTSDLYIEHSHHRNISVFCDEKCVLWRIENNFYKYSLFLYI